METTYIEIDSPDKHLSDVLEEIPSNVILYKTLTGIGATYSEIKAQRHSIIIEPNVPVIIGKCNSDKHKNDNLLGVYEGVTTDRIIKYLGASRGKYYKILTTPESFTKVKDAFLIFNGKIYNTCFLLIDEAHKTIKDVDYRSDIVLPMNDFFKFKGKALVSATPLELSDPRFNDFQRLVIEPQFSYDKDIHIQYTNNTLERFKVTVRDSKNDCICVFLNSTDTIYALMEKTGILEESTVFCANKSVRKLKYSLNFKNAYSRFEPKRMRKFNFFTSRFYAGMDIELECKPDLIMLSDVNLVEHTVLDPYSDMIQIVGRFRNGVNYITHITNTFTDYTYRSKEEVLREVEIYEINYNFIRRELGNAIDNGSQCAFRTLLKTSPFNQFLDRHNNKSYCAVDNYVDEVMVRNMYLSEDTLFTTYTDEVLMKYFSAFRASYLYKAGNIEWLQLRNANKSIVSKRKVIVDILEKILPYETESDYEFRKDIYKSDPLIVEAVEILGIEEVRRLRYITNALKLEIYKAKCQSPQVTELIHDYFKVGGRYLLTDIKTTIKRIYEECGIAPQERVTAQTLRNYFNCDRATPKGKEGLLIVSVLN